jgi:hypothetical protein
MYLNNFENQIDEFVKVNNLRPADAILVKKLPTKLLNHYIVYLGKDFSRHVFMANTFSGIRLLHYPQLMKELQTFQPEKIERFTGNDYDRHEAVNRALARKDENSYDLILNNCEHFKNWVQKGVHESRQVSNAGNLAGIGLLVMGLAWVFGDE